MTRTYNVLQAKTDFSKLLDCAQSGDEVIVIRRGRRFRVIVAPVQKDDLEERMARVDEIRAKLAARGGTNVGAKPLTLEDLLKWRDEGRR